MIERLVERFSYSGTRFVLSLILFVAPVVSVAQQLGVLSRRENVMAFIDLSSGEEIDRLDVGKFCHEIAVDSAFQRAFVGSFEGNTVHVIDLRNRTAHAVEVDGFRNFHSLATNREGDPVWVTAEDSSVVLEFDPKSGGIAHVWRTGGHSHMIAATPDGRKLYTSSREPSGMVVIDRESGGMKSLEVGRYPAGLDITPDGTEVWVVNRDDGTISIIDTATEEVVATIDAGGESPVKIRFSPDGRQAWAAHHLGNTVSVLDTKTRSVIGTVDVGIRPLGLALSGDGSRVYVSRTRANEIVEIDTKTLAILRRMPTANNPDGMVWIP